MVWGYVKEIFIVCSTWDPFKLSPISLNEQSKNVIMCGRDKGSFRYYTYIGRAFVIVLNVYVYYGTAEIRLARPPCTSSDMWGHKGTCCKEVD